MVGWAKAHHLYSLEFEEPSTTLWAFKRTWEKDIFRQVAVTVSDRFSSDGTHDVSLLGSVLAAVGGSASLVAVSGGSHLVSSTYGEYLGSGYNHKLVEYPIFDLRLLKRCLQKVSSIFFCFWNSGSLLNDENYCHAPKEDRALRLDDVTFRYSSCHYYRRAQSRCFLKFSAALWECGFSSWSTLGRLGNRTTATAQWNNIFSTFISIAFFYMAILLIRFRRRESMATFIWTGWREANFACFT